MPLGGLRTGWPATSTRRGFYPVQMDADELARLNGDPDLLDQLFRSRSAQAKRWCDLAASGSTPRSAASSRPATTTRSKPTRYTRRRTGSSSPHSGCAISGRSRWPASAWCRHAVEHRAGVLRGGAGQADRRDARSAARGSKLHPQLPLPALRVDAGRRARARRHAQARDQGRAAEHRAGRQSRRADAIKKYQPVVALHGHIHESRGVQKIGRTLCINPGSDYSSGVLRGAVSTSRRTGRAWTSC